MSATCPACGVAVVPGYVKCPKCHAALPRVVFKRGGGGGASGTAVDRPDNPPWVLIAGGAMAVIAALVIWAAVRHGGAAKASTTTATDDTQEEQTAPAPEAQPVATQQPAPVDTPTTTVQSGPPQRGPQADDVARQLKAALDTQRLWSTVSVSGNVLEVRSAACSDAAMGPVLDTVAASAHAAGLSQLRCVSRSGGVVSTRAL